ncbi:MAG: HAMP domain-containing protein, partial [Trebonia sp.]
MHLNPHLAALAARLPRRTVRLRLTALYGGLFLLSGAGLLAIAITIVLAHGWPPSAGADEIAAGPGTSPARMLQLQAQAAAQAASQHAAAVSQLLASSAIALAAMTVASVALGWIVAGRVLRPLRAMTAATQQISEENLGERLALAGPRDELKDLADTIDGLLARLQGAFDAQRQFVANASHELRTPLTLERTLLELALSDPDASIDSYRHTCEQL